MSTMALCFTHCNSQWKHSAKQSNEEWEIFVPSNLCSDPLACMQLGGLIYTWFVDKPGLHWGERGRVINELPIDPNTHVMLKAFPCWREVQNTSARGKILFFIVYVLRSIFFPFEVKTILQYFCKIKKSVFCQCFIAAGTRVECRMCNLPSLRGLMQTRAQQNMGQGLAPLPRQVPRPGTSQQGVFCFLYLAKRILLAKHNGVVMGKEVWWQYFDSSEKVPLNFQRQYYSDADSNLYFWFYVFILPAE